MSRSLAAEVSSMTTLYMPFEHREGEEMDLIILVRG